MFRRHRLEKEEGKTYNEPGVRRSKIYLFATLNTDSGIGRNAGVES